MPPPKKTLLHYVTPYLLLFLAACVAYLPVSTMTFALKNDILALEFPINYFISESIRHGSQPYWFNTWAGGFPLESVVTWSIFSPVRLVFGGLFHYSLYTLHLEFIFFIALSGCTMYALLEKHVGTKPSLSLLLAACYMLSGFQVSSSQWLLYLTAAAFLPLLLNAFLSLLNDPNWRNALFFSAVFYLHFTSVYVAFTIVAVYLLLALGAVYLWRYRLKAASRPAFRLRYLAIAAGITLVIASPCLYTTLQLLPHLERGGSIAHDKAFFNSNFLHPTALQTLLLPLSSARLSIANTEGSMMHSYIGLLPLLLLPAAVIKSFRLRKRRPLLLLAAAIFFLLVSFGNITPLRGWLNLLPGFEYFRNPGLFRLHFLFFLLLFLYAVVEQEKGWTDALRSKTLVTTTLAIGTALLIVALTARHSFQGFKLISAKAAIQSITYQQTLFFSALLQLSILLALFFAWKKARHRLLALFVFADVILNTMLCTPFFTVSSYSVADVNEIFQFTDGFPVQTASPQTVASTYRKGTTVFPNTNVYRKEVSLIPSNAGPLVLKNFSAYSKMQGSSSPKGLLSSISDSASVEVLLQQPDEMVASVHTANPVSLLFLQNYYPGWKATFNGNPIAVQQSETGGMMVIAPASGTVRFSYKKTGLLYAAIAVNLFVLFWLFMPLFIRLKSWRNRQAQLNPVQ